MNNLLTLLKSKLNSNIKPKKYEYKQARSDYFLDEFEELESVNERYAASFAKATKNLQDDGFEIVQINLPIIIAKKLIK